MKSKISRLVLSFSDSKNDFVRLTNKMFPLTVLYRNNINKYYSNGKNNIIHITFWTKSVYQKYPEKEEHLGFLAKLGLAYFTKIEESFFTDLTYKEQKTYLWERLYQIFKEILPKIKQFDLLEAVEKAYQDGLAVGLNPDFRVLEKDVTLYDTNFKASVWMTFDESVDSNYTLPFENQKSVWVNYEKGIISKFTLEREGVVIYERELDAGQMGNEFFLTAYKKIELIKENTIVIKGHYDMETLPLKIKFTREDLRLS